MTSDDPVGAAGSANGVGEPPDGHEPPIPPREDTQPLPVATEPGPHHAAPPIAPPPSQGVTLGRTGAIVLLAVGLVVVVLATLNVVVARSAETRAEEQATQALGVPVDVRLRGFPVGLRLLSGGRVDATASAQDVPLEGTAATLTQLEVDLVDARVDRAGAGAIEARSATFRAELDDDAVQQLIGIAGRIPLTNIELGNGIARFSFAGFALLDATAEIEGGRVVFNLTAPIANLVNVRLQLEELPFGFQAESVEIRRGVLRLTGSAQELRLES
jgi:hypothetical protein